MIKILVTIDGEVGYLSESSFTKEQVEEAAIAIAEDAEKRDIYLNEEEIIKELINKGYLKLNEKEVIDILQFNL